MNGLGLLAYGESLQIQYRPLETVFIELNIAYSARHWILISSTHLKKIDAFLIRQVIWLFRGVEF